MGKFVQANCPFAYAKHRSGKDNRPSFGIAIEDQGRSFYNCFSCGSAGSLDDLLVELLHLSHSHPQIADMNLAAAFDLLEGEPVYYFQTWEENPKQAVEPWPEWWLQSFRPALSSPTAREYLLSRKVSVKLMSEFDVRYDTMRNAVGFPFRTSTGELAGMRGRYINPKADGTRYHDYDYKGGRNGHLVWFNAQRLDWSAPVVVTEGAFDTVAVYRWYRNVTSSLSATMSAERISELANAIEVVCCFDPDEAGNLAFQKVMKYIGNSTVVRRVIWPYGFDYVNEKWDASSLPIPELGVMLKQFVNLDVFVD